MSRRTRFSIVAIVAALACFWVWRFWWPDDERQIRRRLNAFAAEFNESAAEGLDIVARAARIGAYFTDDVVVEFGKGVPPLRDRVTLVGMATRLHLRTAAFTLELLDVDVNVVGSSAADVSLTASFRKRSRATGEASLDAQELQVSMVKVGGDWRISRVITVEAFR